MKKILFLCTGNYYRSRFSEEYFNAYAEQKKLDWVADSMGLQRDFTGNGNIGPIAENTLNWLSELDIKAKNATRMPKHIYVENFSEFDRVIAVSADEHKPMLEEHFSVSIFENVEYFDVEDLHIEGPETAIPRLILHLDRLINDITL